MNKRDWIILALLNNNSRSLDETIERSGYSKALFNESLNTLRNEGYIDANNRITTQTKEYLIASKPERAVILAAGQGLRMTPIDKIPKAMLLVNDEPLIERIIKQLHEKGIEEIYIVVGYLMEQFEYLIDKYNVSLVYDYEYELKDTLYSLSLVSDKLKNAYIVPSSVWFSKNPFSDYEYFSWYGVSEYIENDSVVRLNRDMELIYSGEQRGGNSMTGVSYLLDVDARRVRTNLEKYSVMSRYNREKWELTLFEDDRMFVYGRLMLGQSAFQIKKYEQLRELDSQSRDLKSKRLNYIGEMFGVDKSEITNISGLFEGMTNRHMRFTLAGTNYLLRVPGEGSNEIINRYEEAEVYEVLKGKHISDVISYITPEKGYKITEFWNNARICDINDWDDVTRSIKHLRKLHDMNLEVRHSFDLRDRISHYEMLRNSDSSFMDYQATRSKVMELLDILDTLPREWCLCHIDSASVNFLFVGEELHLIDWEYAAMCDPHIDIAMFCIFADYNQDQIDDVINIYFDQNASELSRLKVYSYVAISGFLWSIWSEYKANMGVDFGDYTIKQYRYAKEYYKKAMMLSRSVR